MFDVLMFCCTTPAPIPASEALYTEMVIAYEQMVTIPIIYPIVSFVTKDIHQ